MRRATLSNSFTKGVLDPHLSERADLAHFHQSLADAENCVFAPQGGVADRGGFALISDPDVLASGVPRRLRRRLQPIVLAGGMLVAPNGGIAANVIDQDAATLLVSNAIAATPWTLIEVTSASSGP